MNFTRLSLDDKDSIRQIIEKDNIESAEQNFTGFFIWAGALNIEYTIEHNCLLSFMRFGNVRVFRYPLGNGDKKSAVQDLIDYCGEQLIFSGLTKTQAEELNTNFPGMFKLEETPDFADYVYRVSDLIALSGKKYHTKKNHLNAFIKNYDYRYETMNQTNALAVIPQFDKWYNAKGDRSKYLECEYHAIITMLNDFDSFGLTGGVLYADGEICAFTISEQLNSKTVLIHIEKADNSIHGAFTAINQMHLAKEWAHMTYVNREDDFGVPGLRKAKESYRPVFKVLKYRAIIGKPYYRDVYRKKRQKMPADCSHIITNKVTAHPIYEESKIIMAYASTAQEVDTRELINIAFSEGKKVCLPVVESGNLNIVEIFSQEELSRSPMGILEPANDPTRYITPDLIIVPGIAFSRDGYRIGYGGGYYDRLLSEINCPTLGICPEVCLVPSLPHEPHDVRVNYIFTEREEVICSKKS